MGSLLAKRGLHCVEDLLNYYPRAYEDRRAARNLANLKLNEVVSLKVQVVRISSLGGSNRKIYDILVKDASAEIHCKFFRVPYKGYFERFGPYQEVRLVGKVTVYQGRLEFLHPELRDIEPEEAIQDMLAPIYPEIENLGTSKIATLLRQCLSQLPSEAWGPEKFPPQLLETRKLLPRQLALKYLHDPPVEEALLFHEGRSPAHRRIIFEEFFWLELYLLAKKSGLKKEKGISIQNSGSQIHQLLSSLPFDLTGAQKKVLEEIKRDFDHPHPMNRLVQGDVGSGKTLVGLAATVIVAESGWQSCFMAPTEILAEQHFKNASHLLENLGYRTALLTGKSKASQRQTLLHQLEQGEIHLLIGTHALIEEDVKFKNLALVIIDEQHRFGVRQRGLLRSKGISPHVLVMTATPIPRTLAMTVYGDLDISIIDEMPPGRTEIKTRVVYESKRPEVLKFMTDQVAKGSQVYFVFPLVEESEKIDLKNALDEYEKLKSSYPFIRIGLLHGRMKPSEKEEIMESFRRGDLQVLVSTTVVEVGVDVPNASLMIIEHAERFGLSQLHQLRGRVGRGQRKSFCVLILGYAVSEEARARTSFMETTTDGFKIADFDLELRGPGEFLGTRQSGLPGFKMANLVRDSVLLQEAREAAMDIMRSDPQLHRTEHRFLREDLLKNHGITALAGIA